RCADGNTAVTCCIVHAPDRSFGSVLTAAFGCMSGFKALTSSSSTSGAGVVGVFFPKIFESNVAILQFSLQRCALRVDNTKADFLARRDVRDIAINVNFEVCACPAETALFNEHILFCTNKLRSLRQRNPVNQLETSLVPFLDQWLGVRF